MMRLGGICVIVAGMAACAAAESSFTVSDPFIWRDDAAKCYRLYQLSRANDPVGAGVRPVGLGYSGLEIVEHRPGVVRVRAAEAVASVPPRHL